MTNVALTTTQTTLLPASPDTDRTWVIQPDGLIYLCIDGEAQTALTSSNGLAVQPGQIFTSASILDAKLARQAVSAIAAAGTVNVRIQWR